MPAQGEAFDTSGGIPHLERLVIGSRKNAVSIWAERTATNPIGMPVQGTDEGRRGEFWEGMPGSHEGTSKLTFKGAPLCSKRGASSQVAQQDSAHLGLGRYSTQQMASPYD